MQQRHQAIVAFIAILTFLGSFPSAHSQEFRELQQRFDAVAKVVQDPLTDEAGIRRALRELEQLARVTQEFDEEDLEPEGPEAEIAGRIVRTLREVESRLPDDFVQRRPDSRPGFPVPEFTDRKLLADQALTLDQSQKKLARQLRRTEGLGGPEAAELLHAVSVAQEALAWEAGWPFTREEAEAFRTAGRLTEEVYLSRLQRGAKRINEQVSQEHQANGRVVPQIFVLHVATGEEGRKRFSRHLEEVRQVAPIDHELFVPFDKGQADILKGNQVR